MRNHHDSHQQHHEHRHDHPWRHSPDESGESREGRGERGERGPRGRRGGGRGGPGPWGAFGPGGPGFGGGRQGPPPWVAGFFGFDQAGGPGRGEGRRGPRVRRGDVRHAILDVLREAQAGDTDVNGYQVIQAIAERSGEAWKPSPGSVYPTIQQLQDEELVAVSDERSRRALTLTPQGLTYVAEHAGELAAVWAPFEEAEQAEPTRGDLRPEIGQLMAAVWQIASAGSPAQREAAKTVLVETRRKLYGILADGDQPAEGAES